ncbi:hypothetical protein COY90_01720 [Candidatus Roizmanbacteria bacterium CG_4_10_14_0_8_um_filter_39_9]|uniref:DUF2304 domain-containing protein n=1 Tax=Candidatus Roizmanbacteria bacterium CG_4_10_14_0_8_um_filter_39_9 TaxID=1974829 RepID=A0A2M7QEC3_9BACT|nr:MAG: hypothetical protein COY90_01720 [Candidatus Roizmanbacteria bacterium CG_4_10_14_0_8_um_filter_39_9]
MIFQFSPIQGVLVLISLFFLGNRIIKYIRKERTQTVFKLLLTLIIWGGILFTSLFPALVHAISRNIGLGENMNTLIFFGFVVVFVILFKLLSSFESLERQLTEIVRKEALKDL